jgi:membrane-associated phospholipid phosphatase
MIGRILMACGLGAFCGGGYAASGVFNQQRFLLGEAPRLPLDFFSWQIPFSPSWVWIYILYYPFCFLPLLLAPVRKDPSVFLRTVLGFALQFAICFAFFFIWPIQMVHPEALPGLNGQIITHLRGFDGGFNAFPSLHVANTAFVALLFLRFRPWAGWGLLGGSFLIAVSALLIKQHYFYDVLAGALLGAACFYAVFQIRSFRTQSSDYNEKLLSDAVS